MLFFILSWVFNLFTCSKIEKNDFKFNKDYIAKHNTDFFLNHSRRQGVVFKIANERDVSGFDPLKFASSRAELSIFQSLFEGLISNDPRFANPILGLAKEMPAISDDGLVYTFKLRDGLKWSDGHPLTAHDFVYGYIRILTPKNNSKYASFLYPIKGAKDFNEGRASKNAVGVKALDKQTFQVNLENPTAYFLSSMAYLSFIPYPRHAILCWCF